MIEILQTSTAVLLTVTALFSLLVGSFLNVVIHRLPVMMERQWRHEATEFLNAEGHALSGSGDRTPYNLWAPRSACPDCGHQITALENIPLLSYLFLRGRCSECGAHIPLRYPLVEAVTALLSVAVVWHFGFSWQAAGSLVFTWALIALAVIDLRTTLLPDSITLPLLWLGLVLNLGALYTDTASSLIGAVAGYMSLWLVYQAFRLLTGKEGMGFGDFKLFALIGAWLGWQLLPLVILLSSLVGAIVGISLILFQGRDKAQPIPFGPYLAAAGFIALLWGNDIMALYLG
ncbi:MAG: A24 family peptidase [Thioalkalivibrio sp.]